jgi:hypothetical protein
MSGLDGLRRIRKLECLGSDGRFLGHVVADLAGDSLFSVDRARPDDVHMRAHSFATPGELALPIAKVIPG